MRFDLKLRRSGMWVLHAIITLFIIVTPELASAKLTTAPSSTAARAKEAKNQPIKSSNFDFDDNIFTTGARVYLWDNANNKEVGVSTADWANVKLLFGKAGDWKDFSIRPDGLREFADETSEGDNLYRNQIAKALEAKDESWKALSWDAFVTALSQPATRKHVTIITARLHSPDAMMKGLKLLKDKGLIPALPEKANLFPVSWSGLDEKFKAASPAESKAKVMLALLDGVDKKPIAKNAPLVDDADGTGQARVHQWDFSDDDYENFSKAVTVLTKEVASKRWPNTKITIHFTGRNNPDHQPHSVVIKSDGTTREANTIEKSRI